MAAAATAAAWAFIPLRLLIELMIDPFALEILIEYDEELGRPTVTRGPRPILLACLLYTSPSPRDS